ncbi:putative histidine-rich protein III [Gregarina niphandrodes]|uniref:Histidine-rich protein III n=1 Tax=Gregarina niphandrodes TaxID=110365 RepID=A0A023AZ77_GRENI|nr:putative histidine-rich protein III [Gregarina niphandrodes]EZG43952.1 putative histidine-rich protein III [Gregarina niphandrodes]|eukprot:XP_011132883.1 putative histidine-rich protein III [Gregarina niphandrodes]
MEEEDKESYWTGTLNRLKAEEADQEIQYYLGVSGSHVPGVLAHQRALGRLIKLQRQIREERLRRLPAKLPQRNQIAGNTIAFKLYQNSDATADIAIEWAAAHNPPYDRQHRSAEPHHSRGPLYTDEPYSHELPYDPLPHDQQLGNGSMRRQPLGAYPDANYRASQDGAHQDGAYQDGAYRDGTYQDGAYRDGSYQDGVYQEGAYRDGSYKDASYHDASCRDPDHGASYEDQDHASYREGYIAGTYTRSGTSSYSRSGTPNEDVSAENRSFFGDQNEDSKTCSGRRRGHEPLYQSSAEASAEVEKERARSSSSRAAGNLSGANSCAHARDRAATCSAIIPHPDYERGEYRPVSAQWFEVSDVPERELRRRLQRGEIMPREEWVPSDDVQNRKVISASEAESRIDFGEKLRQEGADAMVAGKIQRANVLYTQGYNLLKHYVCENRDRDIELQELLAIFRRNKAVTHLKLKEYRACIATAKEGLIFDEHDGKLHYLLGRSLQHLGLLEEAIDAYKTIATDGFVDEEHRIAARVALKQAQTELRTANLKSGKVVKNYSAENAPLKKFLPAALSTGGPSKAPTRKESLKPIDPPMPPRRFLSLLQDLALAYTVNVH